jgi:hypothetical protein
MVFSRDALAATPNPGWVVSSVAQPTNFSTEDNALCARSTNSWCDRYMVTLTNVGSRPSSAPLVIADSLPQGLKAIEMSGRNLETSFQLESNGSGWTCKLADTTCEYSEAVNPGATLEVDLEVEVEAGALTGTRTNAVRVSGGGLPPVATTEPLTLPNTVNESSAGFGVSAFGFKAHDVGGGLDTQAGDHPNGVTSTINFNTTITAGPDGALIPASVEAPRNLVVYLPLGLLGDPTVLGRCTELQLKSSGNRKTNCPPGSRVGTLVLFVQKILTGTVVPEEFGGSTSAIYNMVPDHGFPAQFGFTYAGVPIQVYASVVHTPAGYALRVGTPGLPTTIHVEGAALTFFGAPNTADESPSSASAFFTNPSDCNAGSLTARVQADSWPAPSHWVTEEAVAYPKITGCNLLQFEPTIEMHPEVTQSEEPTGYEIKIKVPQTPEQFPILATPQLKDVTMTLPEGMTIAAGGAVGLSGCEATGPHGIDMPTGGGTPTEVGEGEALGPDGMTHLTAGHCPQSSQIGTVTLRTPVLEKPVEGHLYVAQPQCGGPGQSPCTTADATNGRLFGLYLEAEGSGVVVKLKGSASVDPTTGRLTARFLENPQLPVSEVAIDIEGGARSPLSNPRQCGAATTSGDLTPWSSPMTPDALVTSAFEVDWDGHGGSCPATLPFAPGFTAGVTNVLAGHFSTFTATVTRGDRQQDLARLQVTTPPGVLGLLSKVPLCGEPQAQEGTCGEASRIGDVSVEAGPGPTPLGVTGRVYLTGPYGGAPFGFSIVVPAVAGPFNLGNVVARARIDVDPHTGAITVTSDALPQFRDGVPLRIQALNVAIDREGFIFNPTSCTAKQVTARLDAEQGASASLSAPFAVEGCKNLPFKPSFKVSTQGGTSKKNGASLDVKIGYASGQANIGEAQVSLPKQLPARLTTLQQACPEATFAQNPASCPAGSDVGFAKVVTPVLNEPLSGPAYVVSHGGAAFPDLVVILQAQGVRLDLVGNTSIKKGITTSTFASAPDAPISSFELRLPEGPHSVLGTNLPPQAKGSMCGQKLIMPTTLTGQNGVLFKQSTKISVSGCLKARNAKARKAKARKARRAGSGRVHS